MMKFLAAVAVAQLALLAALFVRVLDLESALQKPMLKPDRTVTSFRSPAPSSHQPIDESLLRAIVREELSAQLETLRESEPSVAQAASSTDPQEEIEYDYRLEEVSQTLDFYAQTGQIGAAEMARLQSDIANLRPGDREAMLGRLVRELNSGAIDGRL